MGNRPKRLDDVGLGILWGKIKALVYDEDGTSRFVKLATLIAENATNIAKRAYLATDSGATDENSYVKKADDADTLDGKHSTDFANATHTHTISDVTNLQTNLDNKVDKVSGKGLSTNDYTTAEKTKLSGIATGAEVNVQSDWSVTDTSSDAYIANKPTIPTVNNGTLTIKANGTQKGTFTANQSGNTTIDITASDLGLSSALKYIGEVSELPTPTTSDTYSNGDVIAVENKEYVRTGKTSSSAGTWKELGDEGSYALKTISITGTGVLSGGGTLESNRTITHNTSGVTAGTYRSVKVNATGHVTAGTNPTTLSGYGITDAKISNGVITLGSNTITPVTDISGKADKSHTHAISDVTGLQSALDAKATTTALSTETSERKSADETLQTNIDNASTPVEITIEGEEIDALTEDEINAICV